MRYPVIAASVLAIVASTSCYAQDSAASDAHVGAQVDAGNIMPQLVGRVWGNRYTLAKVEREADGRYRLQYGYAVHRINVSNPAAPTTKSSLAGTVLLESDFASTPHSFVLTGTSRAKHKSYFWVMPNGNLRHLFMWQSKGVYQFGSLAELAPSDGTGKKPDDAVVANFYGKKKIAEVESYLGVSLADVDTLKGAAPVRQAAASAPAPARPLSSSPLAKAIASSIFTAPASAAKPVAPVVATGVVDARRWGALAALAGTSWADADTVLDFEWLTPNAASAALPNARRAAAARRNRPRPSRNRSSIAPPEAGDADAFQRGGGKRIRVGIRFAFTSDGSPDRLGFGVLDAGRPPTHMRLAGSRLG